MVREYAALSLPRETNATTRCYGVGMNQPPQGWGPPQGQYGAPGGPGAPPPPVKKGMSTLTIVLIVIGAIAVLGFGSCFVSLAVGAYAARAMAAKIEAQQGAAGGSAGIKECDDYFAKVNVCMDNKEPAAKAAHHQAIEGMKAAMMLGTNQIVATLAGGKAVSKDVVAQKCQALLDKFSPAKCQ